MSPLTENLYYPSPYIPRVTPDVFVAPTGVSGGSGTEEDPYTSLLDLADNMPPDGSVIGIKTGCAEEFVDKNDINYTTVFQPPFDRTYTFTNYGDLDKPLCVFSKYILLDKPEDWLQCEPDDGFTNNYPNTLSEDSNIWVYVGGTTVAKKVLTGFGFGDFNSIYDYVNPGNYTKHVRESNHVYKSYLNPNGTNVSDPGRRLNKQWQWQSTSQIVIVYSEGNPVEIAGGKIYAYSIFGPVFRFINDGTWLEAAQFRNCNVCMGFEPAEIGKEYLFYIRGLYNTNGGSLFGGSGKFNNPRLVPNLPNRGSIWNWAKGYLHPDLESAPNGQNDIPWGTLDMKHLVASNLQSKAFDINGGWWRNCRIRDVTLDMCNLQNASAGAAIALAESFADYGEENHLYDFNIVRSSCTIDRFGASDGSAIDMDGNVSSWWAFNGRIIQCLNGISCTGNRRNQKVFNVEFIDCAKAVDVAEADNDGETEVDFFNLSIKLPPYGLWAESGVNVYYPTGIFFQNDSNIKPDGPIDIDRTFTRNLDIRARNIVIYTDDPTNSYAVVNRTIGFSVKGPFEDADGDGFGDTIFEQGVEIPVPVNNVQRGSELFLTSSNTLKIYCHGFDSDKLYVDGDYNDISNRVGHSPEVISISNNPFAAIDADNFALVSDESGISSNGIPCLDVVEGVDIMYTQPNVSDFDKDGRPENPASRRVGATTTFNITYAVTRRGLT